MILLPLSPRGPTCESGRPVAGVGCVGVALTTGGPFDIPGVAQVDATTTTCGSSEMRQAPKSDGKDQAPKLAALENRGP